MELKVRKHWNQNWEGQQTRTWEESISQPFLKTTLFLISAAVNLKINCFEKLASITWARFHTLHLNETNPNACTLQIGLAADE